MRTENPFDVVIKKMLLCWSPQNYVVLVEYTMVIAELIQLPLLSPDVLIGDYGRGQH
jgi:hypothetical protein